MKFKMTKIFTNGINKKLISFMISASGKKSKSNIIIFLLFIFYFFLVSEHYFKNVKISSTALIKMVRHTKSGNNIEVMGLF